MVFFYCSFQKMAEVNQTFLQSEIKAEPVEDFVTDFDITEDPHLAAFVQASQNSSGKLIIEVFIQRMQLFTVCRFSVSMQHVRQRIQTETAFGKSCESCARNQENIPVLHLPAYV